MPLVNVICSFFSPRLLLLHLPHYQLFSNVSGCRIMLKQSFSAKA
jgi:hypothetical protein